MGFFKDIFDGESTTTSQTPEKGHEVRRREAGIDTQEPQINSEPKKRKYTSTPEEEILEKREKSSSRELGGGVNESLFVELKDDGAGVFKPVEGDSIYHFHERAAYLVDRFLGFNFVPPTTIREIDGRTGSLQRFIGDAKSGKELLGEEKEKIPDDEKMKLNIFDFLISNTDRHSGNYLVKDGRIVAIDHGYSFYCDCEGLYQLNFYRNKEEVEIPRSLREKVLKLNSSENDLLILRDLLLEILPQEEVDSFFSRLCKLAGLLGDQNWRFSGRELEFARN